MGVLLLIARRVLPSAPHWLTIAMWVNLGWGFLNALPIIPFAGGRFLMDRLGQRRATTALLISAATTAVVSTVGALIVRNVEFAILFASVNILSIFSSWERCMNKFADSSSMLSSAKHSWPSSNIGMPTRFA